MRFPAIRAEGLGKCYRIGALAARHRTLREALVHAAQAPYRNLQRLRGLTSLDGASGELVWALRDVCFQVQPGEVLGIIGRNGAGKSTMLKLLSRITEPTQGFADVQGRLGSLLEVGTGFHPELTGRDNVFLNGSILGMDRHSIRRRFDEIVEFAGIGKFIDTPVKRYSSGMYLRLAFAVAAHLEPDVLIVDEVLAVGDAEFQRKCLAKMDDVAHGGRTVLFVSHNMNAIQRLCSRCLLLAGGRLVAEGPPREVVARYLATQLEQSTEAAPQSWIELSGCTRNGVGSARFEALRYASDDPRIGYRAYPDGPLDVTVAVSSDAPRRVSSLAVTLYDQHGTKLVNADTLSLGRTLRLREGRTLVSLRIEALHLNAGTYILGLWLAEARGKPIYDHVEAACRIEVVDLQEPSLGTATSAVVACDFAVAELEPASLARAAEADR